MLPRLKYGSVTFLMVRFILIRCQRIGWTLRTDQAHTIYTFIVSVWAEIPFVSMYKPIQIWYAALRGQVTFRYSFGPKREE